MLSTMRRTVRTLSDSDNEDIRGVKRIADLSDSDEDMPPPLVDDEDGPHLPWSSSSTLAPISSRHVATLSDSEDLEGCCDDCDDCDDLVQECASPSAKPELPLHMVGDGTKFGVELFSGSGNLSKELGRRGLQMRLIDKSKGCTFNRKTVRSLQAWSKLKKIKYLHAAPPCNTYSTVRFPVLRTKQYPAGVPWLDERQKLICSTADDLTRLTIEHLSWCVHNEIAWSLENPGSSRMFHLDFVNNFLQQAHCFRNSVDYCCFGAPWRKRTTIWCWSPTGTNFCQKLACKCSRDHTHVHLGGWCHEGVQNIPTGVSRCAAYPVRLCRLWAHLVQNEVSKL